MRAPIRILAPMTTAMGVASLLLLGVGSVFTWSAMVDIVITIDRSTVYRSDPLLSDEFSNLYHE